MQQQGKAVVIRANQRKQRSVPNNPMNYQELTPEGTESLAMFIVRATPGQSTGPAALQHAGDENSLVLSGKFELDVEGRKYTLERGDSLFLPRGQLHKLTNVGNEPGEIVFVLSPPRYNR